MNVMQLFTLCICEIKEPFFWSMVRYNTVYHWKGLFFCCLFGRWQRDQETKSSWKLILPYIDINKEQKWRSLLKYLSLFCNVSVCSRSLLAQLGHHVLKRAKTTMDMIISQVLGFLRKAVQSGARKTVTSVKDGYISKKVHNAIWSIQLMGSGM